jgi:hypothetical protein
MPLPCNNVSVTPIKVSQLVRYSNLDGDDLLLTVQSGSSLWSRRSTINDLKSSLGRLTGSYSGSFTGSFKGISSGSFSGSYWGKVISKNTVASGSFSGSYWGRILSKNTKASGSFSGSHYGSLISKNTKATGSFSGSHYGSLLSKNTKASGSFSGSHYGSLLSKNTKATGSFRGSVVSTNTIASGSFSGSHYGSLLSKNTKASGSFSGSHYGSLISKNTKATGSFSGSHYGKVIGSNGSLITGSFRGIDNITNFRGTGKKVSFNGTASYAVSSSFANQAKSASYMDGAGGLIFSNALINSYAPGTPASTGVDYIIGTLTVPAGKTLKWFKIEGSVGLYEGQQFNLYGLIIGSTLITTDVYSSWGWGNFSRTGDESDNDFGTRCHFTIEGKPTSVTNSGTLVFSVNGSAGQGPRNSGVFGYAVGYY